MRYMFFGFHVDNEGRPIPNANVSIYLAGTDTPAKVYESQTSPTPLETPPQITTDEKGFFIFWVDTQDYDPTQKFKIVIEKEGYEPLVLDDVQIIHVLEHNKLLGLQGGAPNEYYHLSQAQYNDLETLRSGEDASPLHHHNSLYYTKTEIDSWNLIKNYTLQQTLNANVNKIESIKALHLEDLHGAGYSPSIGDIWRELEYIRFCPKGGVIRTLATREYVDWNYQKKIFIRVPTDYSDIQTAIDKAFENGGGYVLLEPRDFYVDTTLVWKPNVKIIGLHGRGRHEEDRYPKIIAEVSPVIRYDHYTYQIDDFIADRKVTIASKIANIIFDGQDTYEVAIDLGYVDNVVLENLEFYNFTGNVITNTGGKLLIANRVYIEDGEIGLYNKASPAYLYDTITVNCKVGIQNDTGGVKIINSGGYACRTAIEQKSGSIMILNPFAIYCEEDGIYINSEMNLILYGYIASNGQTTSGKAGIRLTANAKKNMILSLLFCGNEEGAETQDYGVLEESGADENIVALSRFVNNNVKAVELIGSKSSEIFNYYG